MAAATGTPSGQSTELHRLGLDCYLQALALFGQAAAGICPHIGTPYQNSLVRVRQRIAFEPDERTLRASLDELSADLTEFSRRVCEYYEQKSGDVAEILEMVAQAVETFETRDQLYLERLGSLLRHLEKGLGQDAATETVRAVYEQQVTRLRTFVERLAADGDVAFDELRTGIGKIEARLLKAETEASIDRLTALVTRRELERLIRARLQPERNAAGNKIFSLLLFDICALRDINEAYGEKAGDEVLRQFGARLVAQVRPRDVVARWGGDEFAVIFDCPAASAAARIEQIGHWVSGRYPIEVDGKDWKAEVEARVTVLEYREGETAEEFLSRATVSR